MRCGWLARALGACASTLIFCSVAAAQPDVIVGDLQQVASWGSSGDIYAYSVGTTSCNVGDEVLQWQSGNNLHPVIGQSMYRYKDGKFDQIGLSWLKHGFCALSQTLCGPCSATPCSTLGVGCSDPYTASRNGNQGNIGPRFEVNAYTGDYPFPYTSPMPIEPVIGRRLQVLEEDIDPAQNAGAQYFVDGHYVTPDETPEDSENNMSYRPITVNDDANFSIALDGTTQQELPAIFAWQSVDPEVEIVEVRVPGEGLMWLGYRVTNIGGGNYHYEYALMNVNSHRAARSFIVELANSVTLSNVEFYGRPYHSGEPISDTPWSSVINGDNITWSTETFAQNPDALALYWGRMFSFRFDANAAPTMSTVSIGTFRNPTTIIIPALTPDNPPTLPVEDLVCDLSAFEVGLSWTNGQAYDSVTILRNDATLVELDGDATSFSDDTVNFGDDVFYEVYGTVMGEDSDEEGCGGIIPTPTDFIRGDVNDDTLFNVADTIFLLQSLFVLGSEQPSCRSAADMNDDGLVDVGDAVYGLFGLFVPGSTNPPAPFPNCGYDSENMDNLTCNSFSACP